VIRKSLVKQAMSEDLKPSGDVTTRLIQTIKKLKLKLFQIKTV